MGKGYKEILSDLINHQKHLFSSAVRNVLKCIVKKIKLKCIISLLGMNYQENTVQNPLSATNTRNREITKSIS